MTTLNKKILIVDTDTLFLDAIGKRLKELLIGVEVIACSDGQDALKKVRRQHPDLVIIEDSLASIDGYKLSRLLKFDKRYQMIPVILLAHHIDEQSASLSKEVGAEELISRFNNAAILEKVKLYLKI